MVNSDLGIAESVWGIAPKEYNDYRFFELRKSINYNINISETHYVVRIEVQIEYLGYRPEVSSLRSGI